ncbi:MAG: hypothetical protein JNN01_20115 [Opitutaceae bacterium]|nr:hypothetical protein [Opitutaceae bacterium]
MMHLHPSRFRFWFLLAALLLDAGRVQGAGPAMSPAPPLFEGTGTHTRVITGAKPETQRYFDQGVALVTNFNYDEGLRSMQQATRLDPECAMAWWGVALACSPHINSPGVSPARTKLAIEALQEAERLAAPSAGATPVERKLIRAMATRFAVGSEKDRSGLDRAYAEAMRQVWREHPDDADLATWCADAWMMLRPWDLWHKDGTPQPGTEVVVAALETALRLNPQHPLANHLAVHAHEASSHPGQALEAANRLRVLTPGLGHLVHMSSHIDVRLGHWDNAIEANVRSIAINQRYQAAAGRPVGGYLSYMGHDYHLLTYAAMMSGRSELAARTMRELFERMPPEWNRESSTADGYAAMQFEVMKRFGKWDEILAAPEPIAKHPHARVWRFLARGIARAAQGDSAGAREEAVALAGARKQIGAAAQYRKNPLAEVIDIAEHLLEGEILMSEGKVEAGLAHLRAGVVREDALRYAEPPAWTHPVRHALGAALLQRHLLAEAEQVYRDDLARNADNGWSLFGLAQTLRLQNKHPEELAAVEARFKEVWAHADVTLTSSCFCLPAAAAAGI